MEAKLSSICIGKSPAIWVKIGRIQPFADFNPPRPKWRKRIRMRCPLCGRRVWSSVEIYHDGDYLIHTLPPHKPKGWWKRRTKKITDCPPIRRQQGGKRE